MTSIGKELHKQEQLRQVQASPWADNKKDACHNYFYGWDYRKPSKIDLAQVFAHLLVASVVIYFLINVFA